MTNVIMKKIYLEQERYDVLAKVFSNLLEIEGIDKRVEVQVHDTCLEFFLVDKGV